MLRSPEKGGHGRPPLRFFAEQKGGNRIARVPGLLEIGSIAGWVGNVPLVGGKRQNQADPVTDLGWSSPSKATLIK